MTPLELAEFMGSLQPTISSLSYYVDFPKVTRNIEKVTIRLNQLNYLIGQKSLAEAVNKLWDENQKAFSVLNLLIAVRNSKKLTIDRNGNLVLLSDYFKSPDHVLEFIEDTGLAAVLQDKMVKNLVDYVFGIEVGLDTNARKNRSGKLMENKVASIFSEHDVPFCSQVKSSIFPSIAKVLGKDIKKFDFTIETPEKMFLIETNFYGDGGSKPNEVARSYSEIAQRINAISGFEFVWITDGIGWKQATKMLEEASMHIPRLYNLFTIRKFITELKALN